MAEMLHCSIERIGFELQSLYYVYFLTNTPRKSMNPLTTVSANGPRDLGSISGRVIPKTFKMVLDAALLNTQQYKVRILGKVEQSWEMSSAPPPTPRCSSYWKGSLLVVLDYGRKLYLLLLSIIKVFLQGRLWHKITHEGWYAYKHTHTHTKNKTKTKQNKNK